VLLAQGDVLYDLYYNLVTCYHMPV
jgi:hypothetical protein